MMKKIKDLILKTESLVVLLLHHDGLKCCGHLCAALLVCSDTKKHGQIHSTCHMKCLSSQSLTVIRFHVLHSLRGHKCGFSQTVNLNDCALGFSIYY